MAMAVTRNDSRVCYLYFERHSGKWGEKDKEKKWDDKEQIKWWWNVICTVG